MSKFTAAAPSFVPRGASPSSPAVMNGGGSRVSTTNPGIKELPEGSGMVADGRGQLSMELLPEELEIQAPLQGKTKFHVRMVGPRSARWNESSLIPLLCVLGWVCN